jgi:hypothetical protein
MVTLRPTQPRNTPDRRVLIVALTSRGRDPIAPAFRKHAGQMRKVFSELSSEELRSLEVALKKIGKRAAALMEQRGKICTRELMPLHLQRRPPMNYFP